MKAIKQWAGIMTLAAVVVGVCAVIVGCSVLAAFWFAGEGPLGWMPAWVKAIILVIAFSVGTLVYCIVSEWKTKSRQQRSNDFFKHN